MTKPMHSIFAHLSAKQRSSHLSARLVWGSAAGILMKIGGTGLSFALAVVLARAMGANNFGIYSYVYALVVLMAMPAEFGLSALVVRETARAEAGSKWALMRGVWQWASRASAALSLLFAVIGGTLAWIFSERFNAAQLGTFASGLLLVPIVALGNLRGAALRGLRRVVVGQLPEAVLRPLFLLLMIVVLAAASSAELVHSPAVVMGLHVFAAAMAFIVGAIALMRARPPELVASKEVAYDNAGWLASTIPLALMGGMLIVNQQVGIIVLGIFRSAEEVGVYKVVMQGALLIAFGMQAINTIVAPYFSRLHAQGDKQRLQRLATSSARLSLVSALPLFCIFVVWGEALLRIVFGPLYVTGYSALVILSAGYCISVAVGLANLLLNMTGHERQTARGVFVALVANVLITVMLTPRMGMNGAALAAAVSLVVWKIQLWFVARRRLGLESAVINLGRFRKVGR